MGFNIRGKRICFFVVFVAIFLSPTKGETCKPEQIRYDFTECDSSDGRYRVAVPKTPDSCEVAQKPTRQKECTFSCKEGTYLDISSEKLECKDCPTGHYSIGGGIRFTDWRKFPVGFDTHSSPVQYRGYGYDDEFSKEKGSNCSKLGWKPLGDSIGSSGDECTSQLNYAVTLRNDQCRVSSVNKGNIYPDNTNENEWRNLTIPLKAGRNLITWEVSAITYGSHEQRDPVYISEIEVQGVAYTSECQPCPAGTFNDKMAAAHCQMCPKNSFSSSGATKCNQCNEVTEFSSPGSSNCTQRKPCTEQDFYSTRSECDANHATKVTFQWIEPKICRDDLEGSVKLPASGGTQDCPPCNPGMTANGTDCIFCPENHYSDGIKGCKQCPVSTSPVYGYDFRWWRNLPPNMKASCFSLSERGCASRQGWQLYGEHITSGMNHADDVYLVLHLETKGFGAPTGKMGQYGLISIVFEMDCQGDCLFKFKQAVGYKSVQLIESWKGKHTKTRYDYIITSQERTTFTWTFQKISSDFMMTKTTHNYPNDRVKIYSINVTNTISGGATVCKDCPVTSKSSSGCVACPPGNYINTKLKQCVPCPENTYLNVTNPYGKGACIPCGPGLKSDKASTTCYSDCKFHSKRHGRQFDFSDLQGQVSVSGAPAFTSRGSRYFHVFHISLCGHPYKGAVCHSNISINSGRHEDFNLTSNVCRFTIIPNNKGQALAVQPLKLGEELQAITEDLEDVRPSAFEDEGLISNKTAHFCYKYHSSRATSACPQGRTIIVTLKCDPNAKDKGLLQMPARCPDGTCDGCKFEFLWKTQKACPVCQVADYQKVTSACESGKKRTTYMWKEPRICTDGVDLPEEKVEECSILDQTVGSAMKDFKIGIGVAALLTVLLVCSVCFLYCKNRRLNYKYHRLVQNASGSGADLPTVERCGMDEDEEDEDEETHFHRGAKERGKKILKSIRNLTSGGKKERAFDDEEDDEFFESVQLEAVKEQASDKLMM
ncbi:predicted protein [Nematostella vectensis]|uniref:MRH domain-containing protein n=1 Tax=Nematostella vectensis TaxID=45351 RepID=A7RIP3_NEMVE|nr:predicted protein [Nematostella vectensis]|eukprot:XP_001640897.1 predicted protein [Nematostella vectensis]